MIDKTQIQNDDILLQIALIYVNVPDMKGGEDNYPTKAIGGGNPYHKCSYCGMSEPEISSRDHYSSCQWKENRERFKLLKGLLNDYEKKNLNDIIDNIEDEND